LRDEILIAAQNASAAAASAREIVRTLGDPVPERPVELDAKDRREPGGQTGQESRSVQ